MTPEPESEKRFNSPEEIRRYFFPNWQGRIDAEEQARREAEPKEIDHA